MAEMSRRQLKLQKRREEWAKEQSLRNAREKLEKLNEAKVNALYYIGIPNSFVLTEVYGILDEYDNLKYKRPTVERLIPELKEAVEHYEKNVHSIFARQHKKEVFFQDVCNVSYGEVEDALEKLRKIALDKVKEAEAKIPELRAQVVSAMVLLEIAEGMYDNVINFISIKDGIDLRPYMENVRITEIGEALRKMSKLLLNLKEMKKGSEVNLDMRKEPRWNETTKELIDVIGREGFVNCMCMKAAELNKEYMPDVYKRIKKEVRGGKY